jgi:hypothetical protein
MEKSRFCGTGNLHFSMINGGGVGCPHRGTHVRISDLVPFLPGDGTSVSA